MAHETSDYESDFDQDHFSDQEYEELLEVDPWGEDPVGWLPNNPPELPYNPPEFRHSQDMQPDPPLPAMDDVLSWAWTIVKEYNHERLIKFYKHFQSGNPEFDIFVKERTGPCTATRVDFWEDYTCPYIMEGSFSDYNLLRTMPCIRAYEMANGVPPPYPSKNAIPRYCACPKYSIVTNPLAEFDKRAREIHRTMRNMLQQECWVRGPKDHPRVQDKDNYKFNDSFNLCNKLYRDDNQLCQWTDCLAFAQEYKKKVHVAFGTGDRKVVKVAESEYGAQFMLVPVTEKNKDLPEKLGTTFKLDYFRKHCIKVRIERVGLDMSHLPNMHNITVTIESFDDSSSGIYTDVEVDIESDIPLLVSLPGKPCFLITRNKEVIISNTSPAHVLVNHQVNPSVITREQLLESLRKQSGAEEREMLYQQEQQAFRALSEKCECSEFFTP